MSPLSLSLSDFHSALRAGVGCWFSSVIVMESQSDSHSAAAAENPDKSLIMSTPVTTLPPSDQTGTLSNLTAHPDYYETLPILGCGCFSFGCLVSQQNQVDQTLPANTGTLLP